MAERRQKPRVFGLFLFTIAHDRDVRADVFPRKIICVHPFSFLFHSVKGGFCIKVINGNRILCNVTEAALCELVVALFLYVYRNTFLENNDNVSYILP